jgi:hypothetical protein
LGDILLFLLAGDFSEGAAFAAGAVVVVVVSDTAAAAATTAFGLDLTFF